MSQTLRETKEFASFEAGQTACLIRFIYKYDGQTKVAPGAVPQITIVDSAGTTQVTDSDSTQNGSETGEYYYEYAIPAAGPEGVWTTKWAYTATKAAASKDFIEYGYIFIHTPEVYDASGTLI